MIKLFSDSRFFQIVSNLIFFLLSMLLVNLSHEKGSDFTVQILRVLVISTSMFFVVNLSISFLETKLNSSPLKYMNLLKRTASFTLVSICLVLPVVVMRSLP